MILVWLGAIVVGVSLGLLGSGGSILTVPILIYMAGQSDKMAIASSLAIVGGIALFGALVNAWQGLISWRLLVLFGLPGVAGTYAGAIASGDVSGAVQLVVFAVIMGLASYSMIKPQRAASVHDADDQSLLVLVASGAGVGLVTGFVGVGGGFLLVPALVILGGLPMRGAVATSLAIVVLNSASGFYKHLGLLEAQHTTIDWQIILVFLGLGIVGSLAGNAMAQRIPQARLRTLFGWFLIVMCVTILWRNVPALI
ncbi:MAG: sulfite exporter TauE/SafE family protein [Salinisphaera sp.]|jgi:uncharacterized membrane protein YfcA|nr:sulfite exporter TauE/SafE family protein [Salinisphaera sp.]